MEQAGKRKKKGYTDEEKEEKEVLEKTSASKAGSAAEKAAEPPNAEGVQGFDNAESGEPEPAGEPPRAKAE